MENPPILSVAQTFTEKDNFLITSHVNPEGDSIGSVLAMYQMLKRLQKKVLVVLQDDVPDNLDFLAGCEHVQKELPPGFKADAVIVLDCPVKERTGSALNGLEDGFCLVNIDHHISNIFFGDLNWVDPGSSSVGEMVFSLFDRIRMPLDQETAEAVYVAIMTDTGMFNYRNTSQKTHEIAGCLIASGVDPKKIHGKVFERRSEHELRLLGRALTSLKTEEDGSITHMTLTDEMYADEGLDPSAPQKISTDEFINFPRSVKNAKVAIFFKENPGVPGRTYVSFRSSGEVDVNKIATRFGGGGA